MLSEQQNSASPLLPEVWHLHDVYDWGIHLERVITRSQTPFYRVQNSGSDLELFQDREFHQFERDVPKQHLLVMMKGLYGAIPRTTLTRSRLKNLELSKRLCQGLEEYKELMRQKRIEQEQGESLRKREEISEQINRTDNSLAEMKKLNEEEQKKEIEQKQRESLRRREEIVEQINRAEDSYVAGMKQMNEEQKKQERIESLPRREEIVEQTDRADDSFIAEMEQSKEEQNKRIEPEQRESLRRREESVEQINRTGDSYVAKMKQLSEEEQEAEEERKKIYSGILQV